MQNQSIKRLEALNVLLSPSGFFVVVEVVITVVVKVVVEVLFSSWYSSVELGISSKYFKLSKKFYQWKRILKSQTAFHQIKCLWFYDNIIYIQGVPKKTHVLGILDITPLWKWLGTKVGCVLKKFRKFSIW